MKQGNFVRSQWLNRGGRKKSVFTITSKNWVALVTGVLAVTILTSATEAYGQKATHAQPPVRKQPTSPAPQPANSSGYLSKLPPTGLRFAPPPKPPVSSLPPLPITYDPQPVFSPDFAQPLAEFPNPPKPTPPPPRIDPQDVEVAELASIFTNKTEKIPPSLAPVEAVSPQMLIKFFQNAKPAEVQMLVPDPVYFRVPVREERRSSSATYEVK